MPVTGRGALRGAGGAVPLFSARPSVWECGNVRVIPAQGFCAWVWNLPGCGGPRGRVRPLGETGDGETGGRQTERLGRLGTQVRSAEEFCVCS